MKILILCIYNETDYYNTMLNIQKKYLTKFDNIDVYFIKYDNSTSTNGVKHILGIDEIGIDETNNIISVKGTESLLNIMHKTLLAFAYFINYKTDVKYDYIIRSNISTLINIVNLSKFLRKLPANNVYVGGKLESLESLEWYDPKSGITNESMNKYNMYTLKYIQGFSIIFSYDVVKFIVDNNYLLNHNIVDDVTIGLFIRNNLPNVYETLQNPDIILPLTSYNEYNSDAIFIINNLFITENVNRCIDLDRMNNIVDLYFINSGFNKIKNDKFPKTIHLIHKSKDLLEKSYKQWADLNPEYNIIMYDDNDCKTILLEHYGQVFLDIFNFIRDGAIKCDFFRVCILYMYGGIYADADIAPNIPISEFVEDDIDFATCISYNYLTGHTKWQYNPQFIVAKKFDTTLYKIIKNYVNIYIKKSPYDYWEWSICRLFETIFDFDIKKNEDNIFILDGKKYKFVIETVINLDTGDKYDFTNMNQLIRNAPRIDVYCQYKEQTVFYNFSNK